MLAAACMSPQLTSSDPLQIAFGQIEDAKFRLDGKAIRTVARYYSNGHDVALIDPSCLGLIDPGCPHLIIEPARSQTPDESYEALDKALSEFPPRSPPVKLLEIDVSGLYHARPGNHGGVLELQKIWSIRPVSDF